MKDGKVLWRVVRNKANLLGEGERQDGLRNKANLAGH